MQEPLKYTKAETQTLLEPKCFDLNCNAIGLLLQTSPFSLAQGYFYVLFFGRK